jgi:deoxyribonuclease-4
VLIGSHVRSDNPLQGALDDEADAVQFFLGDPQSWKKPPPAAGALFF